MVIIPTTDRFSDNFSVCLVGMITYTFYINKIWLHDLTQVGSCHIYLLVFVLVPFKGTPTMVTLSTCQVSTHSFQLHAWQIFNLTIVNLKLVQSYIPTKLGTEILFDEPFMCVKLQLDWNMGLHFMVNFAKCTK